MEIINCTLQDAETILKLYDAATELQRSRNVVVWPKFEKHFIENEINEKRQWKLIINNEIACNWAITYNDADIWEEKEKNDSIYIHRIATNPGYRGNNFVSNIVEWARSFAKQQQRKYIRLDTLGNNTRLIEHYTKAGFTFLGIVRLANVQRLPAHYHKEPDCLLFEMPV
jgi:hypothetical protein